MYTTCAFCNGKLDGDGGPSGLGVGRRLAFDAWKGRLWVICPKCSRWNLAPLEERWEKVEALARAAREGRVAAATAQVALIRWQAYDLVQVGKPPRLELATWRYGERLKARRPGPDAAAALRRGLTYLNLARGGRQRAEDAARLVEASGGPDRLIRAVARSELTVRSLAPDRRLALEMAVDEQAEVAALEQQWKDAEEQAEVVAVSLDRKSTRLNSSHVRISYAVFCLKKKKNDALPMKLLQARTS